MGGRPADRGRASDWLDGKIARALNQQSRLGQLLDPAADRLYIVATVIALAVRAIIPWWLVALLAARELLMAVVLAVLRRRGWGALRVSFVGKTATLCLLYAFPLLFLGLTCRRLRRDCEGGRLDLRYLGKCPVLVRGPAVRGRRPGDCSLTAPRRWTGPQGDGGSGAGRSPW